MNDKQIVAQYRKSKKLPEGKTYADVYAAAKRIGKPFKGRPPGAAKKIRGAPKIIGYTMTMPDGPIAPASQPRHEDVIAQELRERADHYRTAATKIDAALAALNGGATK